MSTDMIRVEPSPERRRCFAGWAVAQSPKLRTVDYNAFAVPASLFTQAPEEILIGATVDGRPYVPVQDEQEPAGEPYSELREAVPGEPLPPLPESAYGPDSTPLEFAPLEDAPPGDDEARDQRDQETQEPTTADGTYTVLLAAPDSDSSDSGDEDQAQGDEFPCDLCDRSFTTSRGRDTHRRQIHPDSDSRS